MRRVVEAFVVAVGVVLVSSCAITAGSAFSGIIAAEATGASGGDTPSPQPGDGPGDEPEPDVQLVVRTTPDGADVWIDGSYAGTTPLELGNLRSGTYRLRIEADGYYAVARWVEIDADRSVVLEVELEQIVGYLSVTATPSQAEVRVDGQLVQDGFAELPVGSHRVHVSAFGYRDRTETVVIREDALTSITVPLEAAPFELSSVSVSRASFNPANPGATGMVRLDFRVSAPGAGEFSVIDSTGRTVWSQRVGPFSTWEQSVRWDGTGDGTGRQAPDGMYELVLELDGRDGRSERAVRAVAVDSSLTVRYRSVWHAAPGLLYAYSLAPLPAAHAQVTVQAAGIVAPVAGEMVARFPVKVGARIGLGSGVELGLGGSLIANSAPLLDRWGGGVSATWSALRLGRVPEVRAGIAAGASYRTPDLDGRYAGPDTFADFPGFFVAAPVTLGAGPVTITAAPELRLSPAPVIFGDDPVPANAWTPYGYFKGGVAVDAGNLAAALSMSLRSAPLTGEFAFDVPAQAGMELHWVLPGTSIAVTGFAAGEFLTFTDFYFMGGAGIGVLF